MSFFYAVEGTSLPATIFVEEVPYNPNGQIESIEYGNGNITTYTYDPVSFRLTEQLTEQADGTDIQKFTYTYDAVGNILSITDHINTASQTFKYDALNRLVEANGTDSQDGYGLKTYSYDELGNITSKDGKTYSYDKNVSGPHAVLSTQIGGTIVNYTYDANGNMATKQEGNIITHYTYDIENRLTKIEKQDTVAQTTDLHSTYEYDGDGGRTKKVDYSNGSAVVTTFIGKLCEVRGSQEIDHIYFGDTRIASIIDGVLSYYHHDHLGGTNLRVDAQGVVQELVEYKPFGATNRSENYGSATEAANYYFTNQYRDNESGLYYYGARYYDPSLGRFITADPIVGKAGVPIMLNRYAYVGNNPIMNIDPSGHIFGFIFAAVKAIVSFAVAHPFIAGAVVGAASGGITAYQNGGNIFQGIALGGLQGGLAGYTLGLSPGTPGLGAGLGLLKASAAVSLTSQVVDAAGQEAVAQGLRYASMGLSAAYVGLNVGIGIKDWASSKLSVSDLAGNPASVQSNDNVFVNGILTEKQGALNKAAELNALKNAGITKVAHNPTSGFIADMTESFLQKITFTSSVDRQLANMVKGLNNITFTGHSQGTLITGNALLNLGFSDNRNVVTNSLNFSTPLSQPRAAISAAIGGTGSNRFIYANNWGDPINVIGPNVNPPKFLSGFGLQIQNH